MESSRPHYEFKRQWEASPGKIFSKRKLHDQFHILERFLLLSYGEQIEGGSQSECRETRMSCERGMAWMTVGRSGKIQVGLW